MLGRSGEAPQGGQQLKAGAHLPSLGEGLDACVAYSVLGFRGLDYRLIPIVSIVVLFLG